MAIGKRTWIKRLLRKGFSQRDVAEMTGIPRRTLRDWLKSEKKDSLKPAKAPPPPKQEPPPADNDDFFEEMIAEHDRVHGIVEHDNVSIGDIPGHELPVADNDDDEEPPLIAEDEDQEPPIRFPRSDNLDWCEQTREGWRHVGGVSIDGEGKLVQQQYDPGVVYPPDWNGPTMEAMPSVVPMRKDGVQRFLITSAQDRTPAHGPALVNLIVLAKWLNAEFFVGQFLYNRDWYSMMFGSTGMDERVKKRNVRIRPYSSALEPWLTHKRHEISDTLVYAAEVPVVPTADRPLSSMLTYGRGKSTIISHAKQELESVPRSNPSKPPVFAMTTGAVTCHNYTATKAGYKAAFHHTIGALLVEIDADGYVYHQHVHCDPNDGRLQVYDVVVDRGSISRHNPIAGLVLGDTHIEHLDPAAEEAVHDAIDRLMPEHVFSHDTIDFYARNHHNRNNPRHNFEMMQRGAKVEHCFRAASEFLVRLQREWTTVHAVESNHDNAFSKWLDEADPNREIVDAIIYHKAKARNFEAIRDGEKNFSIWEWAIREYGVDVSGVNFIHSDGNFSVAGVECGMHGDRGPNGSRGSVQAFLRLAEKIAHGHTHSATKRQGVACGGTIQCIDPMPLYARGDPSSWSQSCVIIYPNGQSGILVIHKGRAFASGQKRMRKAA